MLKFCVICHLLYSPLLESRVFEVHGIVPIDDSQRILSIAGVGNVTMSRETLVYEFHSKRLEQVFEVVNRRDMVVIAPDDETLRMKYGIWTTAIPRVIIITIVVYPFV